MSGGILLSRAFYERPTSEVARDLLGCFLVRRQGQKLLRGKIIETEAYAGEHDRASHAWRGKTPRNAIMFEEAGRWYVYLVYGMHHCLNIVTEEKGTPAAVLLRAVDVKGVPLERTNGPGKLTRFFAITKDFNGEDATTETAGLWIEGAERAYSEEEICATPRIGVGYAGRSASWKRRFLLRAYEHKLPKPHVAW